MVPQNSHGEPPRSFSPAVEEQLARALTSLSSLKQKEPTTDLRQAIEAAGREAQDRALDPQELIVAFKRLEQRLDLHGHGDDPSAVALRTKLIRLLLEAYYA
jgi:hypothetical protein